MIWTPWYCLFHWLEFFEWRNGAECAMVSSLPSVHDRTRTHHTYLIDYWCEEWCCLFVSRSPFKFGVLVDHSVHMSAATSSLWWYLDYFAAYPEHPASHKYVVGKGKIWSTAHLDSCEYSWRRLHQNSTRGYALNFCFSLLSDVISIKHS
jgi:hypothetical protein